MTPQERHAWIAIDAVVFGGKPIVRARRPASDPVPARTEAGDDSQTLREGYRGREQAGVPACTAHTHRMVANACVGLRSSVHAERGC